MRNLLALLLFLSAVPICAQIHEPVKFTVAREQTADSTFAIVFSASIADGWHIYAPNSNDSSYNPAAVTFERTVGAEPVGKLTATTNVRTVYDDTSEKQAGIMEHKAVLVQKMHVSAADYSVKGYLTYSVCNENSCLPPARVEFSFNGNGTKIPESIDETAENQPSAAPQATTSEFWEPVVDEMGVFGDQTTHTGTFPAYKIFLLGLLGGFIALLTPCVWPIIPMTVSFFLKRAADRRKALRDAAAYGASIIVIYVTLGLIITALFGASALNALSTNAWFNIFFFLLLLLFAISFFGAFEISLPASWANAVDTKAGKTTGFVSIFLMAFTLSLVSFSCTGPIIGFLLVEVSANGYVLAPAVGMTGFALALALPFALFALFPSYLKTMPRSGNWMNCVKVTLGFLELAFSLKFLSVADLAYGWHLLDREVFLSLWIIIFSLLGAYLIGWLRFPHDEDEHDADGNVKTPRTPVARFFLALVSFAFALYMLPGLWGAPLKAVGAFAPPLRTQDFNLYNKDVNPQFSDYDLGMQYARAQNMPVVVDFTGFGCVNCRKMELSVLTDPAVSRLLNNYVLISLYVDDKTKLPKPIKVTENGKERTLRTVGDRWSYLQRTKFGANAQPFYVLLDNNGRPLNKSCAFNADPHAFVRFLQAGLENYKRR